MRPLYTTPMVFLPKDEKKHPRTRLVNVASLEQALWHANWCRPGTKYTNANRPARVIRGRVHSVGIKKGPKKEKERIIYSVCIHGLCHQVLATTGNSWEIFLLSFFCSIFVFECNSPRFRCLFQPPFRIDSSAGRGSAPLWAPAVVDLAPFFCFFLVVCQPPVVFELPESWVTLTPLGFREEWWSVCRSLLSPAWCPSCRPLGFDLWLTPLTFSDASMPFGRRLWCDVDVVSEAFSVVDPDCRGLELSLAGRSWWAWAVLDRSIPDLDGGSPDFSVFERWRFCRRLESNPGFPLCPFTKGSKDLPSLGASSGDREWKDEGWSTSTELLSW